MRIHSDILTVADVYDAVSDLPGVYVTVSENGSRTHRKGFEVSLEGNGYARNTGSYGSDRSTPGATWDEWGVFLARLFDVDPRALPGSVKYPVYVDAGDFHRKTATRFADLTLPEDTHKRHTWEYSAGLITCKKCTATQNRG